MKLQRSPVQKDEVIGSAKFQFFASLSKSLNLPKPLIEHLGDPGLKEIRIVDYRVSDDQMKAIVNTIPHMNQLKAITLVNTSISDKALSLLLKSLYDSRPYFS